MQPGIAPSCPLPSERLTKLFRGQPPEEEQKLLREEMRQRLHPITCRICRQELAYFRDVGRFPLEEVEVQTAYSEGRGYRSLLNVWWGRISDHLSGELKEMPAVSSYYRHMSFHLGIRTEREPVAPAVPTAPSLLARSGGFAIAPAGAPPAPAPAAVASPFPTVIFVSAPPQVEGSAAPPAPRAEPAQVQRSMLRMARTMVDLEQKGAGSSLPTAASELLGRAAGQSASAGGYAVSTARARKRTATD